MSSGGDQFEHHVRVKGDDRWHVQTGRCCVCGKTEDVRDSKPGGMPVSGVAQKLRQRGWEIGSRRNKDRCPLHSRVAGSREKAGKSKRSRRAAYVAIEARKGQPGATIVDVAVADVLPVARAKGVLAMADPVKETTSLAMDMAVERLAGLGKVTRRAPEPPPPPPPEVKRTPRRRVVVDSPQFNPEPGTDYVIPRRSRGGPRVKQTGWAANGSNSASNLRKSARSMLGDHAKEGEDFALFTEPDGTMGWKPLKKPDLVAAVRALPPHPEPAVEPQDLTLEGDDVPATPIEQGGNGAPERPAPEWTRDQRKAALEGLDTHYDEAQQRYKGDCSDAKLGEKLNLPRALIAEVREQFFGPDRNEASAQAVRDLKTLRADAERLAARHLELATEAEAFAARCGAALTKMGV